MLQLRAVADDAAIGEWINAERPTVKAEPAYGSDSIHYADVHLVFARETENGLLITGRVQQNSTYRFPNTSVSFPNTSVCKPLSSFKKLPELCESNNMPKYLVFSAIGPYCFWSQTLRQEPCSYHLLLPEPFFKHTKDRKTKVELCLSKLLHEGPSTHLIAEVLSFLSSPCI